MKVWISKYALTKGLYSLDDCELTTDGKWVLSGEERFAWRLHLDAHESFALAKARAEDVRRRKVQSLRRKIEELEKLTFDEEVDP